MPEQFILGNWVILFVTFIKRNGNLGSKLAFIINHNDNIFHVKSHLNVR